jgi:ABC-type transport system substrate-binding protein
MVEEGPRMELYKKAQRVLLEMGAGIPLVDQVTVVGVRKEVAGYAFNVVTFPVLYDVSLTR